MTGHLLAVSIGPVQELIAAARRTRDLWFGSYLLAEISRAVAQSVESHGRLIFPASSESKGLANIILAELKDLDPKIAAAEAKKAAQNCWVEFANKAKEEASAVICPGLWDDQVKDTIEFYAAWVLQTSEYRTDRARVMRLLDGRKNLRDFSPAKGKAGVPKSSLDGQRESVFKDGDRSHWPKNLRLSKGEQLDVLGVVKRLGRESGESHPSYSSVARVAAETWLRGVAKQDKLAHLKGACEKLVEKGLHKVREEHYQYFPYEGTIVYKHRHKDLCDELGLDLSDLAEVTNALNDIGGDPNPYLAVLVADGDRMGQLIATLESPKKHRQFSEALASFADNARTIVNTHRGVLVYAGGDDVLAFLPVDQCLKCARTLHDEFTQKLEPYKDDQGRSPTLSVGLGIGHFMENLEDLLEYGRAAERHAKLPKSEDGEHQKPRDGLAVHVHKRSGGPIEVRTNWSDQPDIHLQKLAQWINDRAISGRVAYDLRNIATIYDNWQNDNVQDAIQRNTLSILRGKQPAGDSRMGQIAGFVRERVQDAASLRHLAEELLVARQIAAAIHQAEGQPANQEASA